MLYADIQSINIIPKDSKPPHLKGISILDAKLVMIKGMHDIPFSEISDLAYDETRGLFALSDKGDLFALELSIKDKKIHSFELKNAWHLKNKKGKRFSKKKRDAEGMDFHQGQLLISFERKPKVSAFTLQGRKIKNVEIAPVLKDINNYQGKNSALEALIQHPRFGLITAPQDPLKHMDKKVHTLFSKDNRWSFKADASITAMENMSDGSLLILEKEFHPFTLGHTIWLKKVDIMNCKEGLCKTDLLARLESSKGWTLDNFEGLARLDEKRYLMISDDNDSFLQKCIVVLFEVK